MEKEIKILALDNAIKYKGKTNPGALVGKILGKHPDLKKDMKSLMEKIKKVVEEVNSLSIDEQKNVLKDIAPELLEKKKKDTKKELPPLPDAIVGKVVTRIPPEPSKYNHIGHGLSFLINYMYAKKYDGKCILKFEDTNPEKCTEEYAKAMEEDILGYLDIKASEVVYISDDMDVMYEDAKKIIKEGKAYVCLCDRETMQDLRHKGKGCSHREVSPDKNIELWNDMLEGKYEPGKAVLRLKGDMESDNQVMRDPVLFRISDAKHFRHGEKYCVWPLYDFENSVEDSRYGVTHVMRSNEFGKMRNDLQRYIKSLFGYKPQTIIHYGRFQIPGKVTQGREIRELIAQKKVTGWDDPSLVTLRALKRRGIVKETLYELVHQVGLSQAPTNIDWTVISSINRSILDKSANRYFFIPEPVKVDISGSPEQEININKHPDLPEKGDRKFKTSTGFYLAKKDVDELDDSSLHRLMDCLNFKKMGNSFVFDSLEYDEFKEKGKRIIHWVPAKKDMINVKVRMPDNTYVEGYGEDAIQNLAKGDIIQFQRFGFCRFDRIEEGTYIFWFTHK